MSTQQRLVADFLLKDLHSVSTVVAPSGTSRQPVSKQKRTSLISAEDDSWKSIGYVTSTLPLKKLPVNDFGQVWVHSLRKGHNSRGKINKTDRNTADEEKDSIITIDLRNKGIDHKGIEMLCDRLENASCPHNSHDFSTVSAVSSSVDLRLAFAPQYASVSSDHEIKVLVFFL